MWAVARSAVRPIVRTAPCNVRRGLANSRRGVRQLASSCRTSAPQFTRHLCGAVLPPLIVVLDMDECLVHTTEFSRSAQDVRQFEASRPEHVSSDDRDVERFPVSFADSSGSLAHCLVLKRTGLDTFLTACCEAWETYVFTAGTQHYADAVLDKLDPERRLAGRLYRSDCLPISSPMGGVQFLKDLEAVAKRSGRNGDFSRMVLVDNNPVSFVCQPRNGIPVPDFVGHSDDVLPRVLELLKHLSTEHADVRMPLHKFFALEDAIGSMRQQLFGPDKAASRL